MLTVSASSIKEFRRCPRKWYTRKVLGILQPETHAQRKGKRMHSLLEAWLDTGRLPKHPRALAATRAFTEAYPLPSLWFPERDVEAFTLAGVPVVGRMDGVYHGRIVSSVVDWKTTSGKRYMQTPETLVQDEQAQIYAGAILEANPHTVSVDLAWVYTMTRGKPQAKCVRGAYTRAMWALDKPALTATVLEMKAAFECVEGGVKQNTAACNDFGGCPYRARCWPKPEEAMASEEWFPDVSSIPDSAAWDLYIDVVMVKGAATQGSAVDLVSVVETFSREVAAENKVADPRLVPFGAGKGHLAAKLRAWSPKGDVFATRSNELSNLGIEVLAPRARRVYLGTR